jgi:hypothetical protein
MNLVVNIRHQDCDVYIGRGSPWGNPFKIGKDGDRAEVIQKYRDWINLQPELIAQLPNLKNKKLGCFCAPKACHGDVLLNLILKKEKQIMAKPNQPDLKMTTCPVTVWFPHGFKPQANKGEGKPKFNVTLLFKKDQPEQKACCKKLYGLAEQALKAWPFNCEPPRTKLMGADNSPIKDGDTACNNAGVPLKEKYPEMAGHWIVRAASHRSFCVVDRRMEEVLDEDRVYGGCICKVNLNPYAFNVDSNKGITFGLNGVQLWAPGERIGGKRPEAEDMFDAADADNPDNFGAGGAEASDNGFFD